MKIWAISKEKGAEYEVGMECDGMDRETATTHATMLEMAAQPSEMMISFIGLPQKPRAPFSET